MPYRRASRRLGLCKHALLVDVPLFGVPALRPPVFLPSNGLSTSSTLARDFRRSKRGPRDRKGQLVSSILHDAAVVRVKKFLEDLCSYFSSMLPSGLPGSIAAACRSERKPRRYVRASS